jgi:DNA-binding winged helix-turn-helix (wHTH) protein/TolB-like protein
MSRSPSHLFGTRQVGSPRGAWRESPLFRFASHTFDPDTGELDGPRESLRLQPKPARLLALLLAAGGDLVERDEIREALWPDTNVDFDAGLNTCVRQIRTALRETGGDPECIETLPKRGYRIAVSVRAEGMHAQPGPGAVSRPRRVDAAAALPYVVVFVLLAVGTGAVMWSQLFGGAGDGAPGFSTADGAPATGPAGSEDAAVPAAARLAVVPFLDPDPAAPTPFNRELTEAFVTALVAAAPAELIVIGPSTTAQYHAEGASLPEIAAGVNADFVLHGGHRASSGIFFVEVVSPDGAHVFARRFELEPDDGAVAESGLVTAMVAAMLELRRGR